MAKNSKKLPIQINVLDPIFYIEEIKDPETGGTLFAVQANLVERVGVDDINKPTQVIVNEKYNLSLTVAPGVKKINEVIIDENDAMDTLEAHIKKASDEYKAEIKKLEKRIQNLKNLFEMYSKQPLSALIKSPLEPAGTVVVNLSKSSPDEKVEEE